MANFLDYSGLAYYHSKLIDYVDSIKSPFEAGEGEGSAQFINAETYANNDYCLAIGYNTQANGYVSHAEGISTIALGEASHVEGIGGNAVGDYTHVEGNSGGYRPIFKPTWTISGTANTTTYTTTATVITNDWGIYDIVEYNGKYAYITNIFLNNGSTVKFNTNITLSNSAITDGKITVYPGNIAVGNGAHVEGSSTIAYGTDSHAEGRATRAINPYSHTEGYATKALGDYSHAEGSGCKTTAAGAHAEGYNTTANGQYSHTEGYSTIVNHHFSHAEGYSTQANGQYSHAEGYYSRTHAPFSHVEGTYNYAYGDASHAAGTNCQTLSSAAYSTATGMYVIANNQAMVAMGKYNKYQSNDNIAFVIGNGNASVRSNAFWVTWDGDVGTAKGILSTSEELTLTELRSKVNSNTLTPGKTYVTEILQNGYSRKLILIALTNSVLSEDGYLIAEASAPKLWVSDYDYDNEYFEEDNEYYQFSGQTFEYNQHTYYLWEKYEYDNNTSKYEKVDPGAAYSAILTDTRVPQSVSKTFYLDGDGTPLPPGEEQDAVFIETLNVYEPAYIISPDEEEEYADAETYRNILTRYESGGGASFIAQVKYMLNFDATKFENSWATNICTTNSDLVTNGVIYWMRDQWGNEAPFNFKDYQLLGGLENVYLFGGQQDNSETGRVYCNKVMPYYENSKLVAPGICFRNDCHGNIVFPGPACGADFYNNPAINNSLIVPRSEQGKLHVFCIEDFITSLQFDTY